MSWFGFGGSKKPEPSSSAPIEQSFDNQPIGLSSSSNSFSSGDFGGASSSAGGGFRGGGGMDDLQGMMMQEQQKVMAQQLILKLTDIAFDKCVAEKGISGNTLSSSQRSCVIGSVSKYIDGTALVISTMTKQN